MRSQAAAWTTAQSDAAQNTTNEIAKYANFFIFFVINILFYQSGRNTPIPCLGDECQPEAKRKINKLFLIGQSEINHIF